MAVGYRVQTLSRKIPNGFGENFSRKIVSVNIAELLRGYDSKDMKNLKIYWIINMIIFLLMLILNYLTPLIADDYAYSFIYTTNIRINNLSDIFQSQYYHYFSWGGRSVVHFLAQYFLWVGKAFFNIVNSLVFVLLINLISIFAIGKKNIKGLLSAFFLIWFLSPAMGSVCFWLTGSCNYLWGTTIVLFFIYIYYRILIIDTIENSNIKILFLFILGFIAGWCNENTSGAGILINTLFTMSFYYLRRKYYKWQISGLIGALCGFCLLILAPGNRVREQYLDTPENIIIRLYNGFLEANKRAFASEGTYKILFAILVFSYISLIFLPVLNQIKIIGSIWFGGSLACNFAMILSPIYPSRASFAVYVLYFISLLYCVNNIVRSSQKYWIKFFIKIILVSTCLYFSVSYMEALFDISESSWQNKKRVTYLLQQKAAGESTIIVSKIDGKTKYNVFYWLNDWPDYGVEQYFNVKSIIIEE